MPTHMRAYLPGAAYGSSSFPNLEHTHFWNAQKADITVFEHGHNFAELLVNKEGKTLDGQNGKGVSDRELFRPETEGLQERKVNIISDGWEAKIHILD